MKKRYILSMLSMFVLVLLFDSIYVVVHKSMEMFLTLAAVHLVLFGLINFFGALMLYRPIEVLEAGQDTARLRKRIQRLAWYSSSWIFFLGVAYIVVMFTMLFLFALDTGGIAMEKIPVKIFLAGIPSILYAYAILPAFITYFSISDFLSDLKLNAFSKFGLIYPVGKNRIGITLLVTFLILGFIPSLLVILELIVSSAGDDYAQFSNMSSLDGILPDRFIVFIGMIIAVIFISRSFTKPIYELLSAINKVREGDFSTQAAIIAQDEIGILTKDFNEMVIGLKEREMIKDTFGKYVTKDVAEVILENGINLTGEARLATILVTDIANYTTISETMAPAENVKMLNEYFSVLVDIIHQHKGVVNKFIGDSVFAFFNVPLDDPDHAENAINAALEIHKLTATHKFGNQQKLTTRIGINTGSVIAGNIGSADRMEYTVIGDDVNVAARLEQLNKQSGTELLLGENTYALAKDNFNCTELGEFQLKGKEKLIKVYQVEA